MRILMVNKFYPPDIGGVESVVAQYAKAASAAGHEVQVLTCHSRAGLPTQTEDEAGVRVTRCRSWGTVWSMPISPHFLLQLLRIAPQFDLVHFHEPFPLGTLAALLTRHVRYVITWHSDIVRQKAIRPLFQALQLAACRRAAVVTTTSAALAESSQVLRRVPEKVRVVPLSIDLDNVSRPTQPLVAPPYCLYLGRLARYKGLDTLIEALKHTDLGTHKLVIAGQGPERDLLLRALQTLGDRIVFIDRSLSDDEKHALLAHCSFLVFPSSAENEAFGIVQLEAMAQGRPVLNTSLPTGVPWVSPHGETGITVPPRDAAALAAAIGRLVSDRTVLAAAEPKVGTCTRADEIGKWHFIVLRLSVRPSYCHRHVGCGS